MRVIHPFALAAIVSLVSACDGPDGETSGFTARDSAGVRIAESTSPAWDSTTRWTIDSTLLVVGEADADADQQLHRISCAVRLADGTLVIANG